MKVLLVEDDEEKRRQLSEFLAEIAPDTALQEAISLRSGLEAILAGRHDLVILDMTMPTYDIAEGEDGGRPQAYGGRELLRHMKRRRLFVPAVVVTQFDRFGEGDSLLTLDELDSELREAHPQHYLGAVYYNVSYQTWRDELAHLVGMAKSRLNLPTIDAKDSDR